MNVYYRPCGDDSTAGDAGQPRVALYTSGHQTSSLDRQEAALRSFLTTHQPQWSVVAVYRDVAPTSGWRAIGPGLQHLLDAAASAAFDLLLVHRLDRLSRHAEQMVQVAEQLTASGVVIRSVTEPFDSTARPGT